MHLAGSKEDKGTFPVDANGDYKGQAAPGSYSIVYRSPGMPEDKQADKIDNVKIPAKLIRVRNIPGAVITYSKQQKAAAEFVNYLASNQCKAIFNKHGYSIKPPKI